MLLSGLASIAGRIFSSITHRPYRGDDERKDQLFTQLPYTNLVLDLGGVLLTWSDVTDSPLSADVIRSIYRSAIWFDFQKGKITEEELHQKVSNEIGRAPHEIAAAFKATRNSLRLSQPLMKLLRAWKHARPDLRIYIMSNISHADWDVARRLFSPDDLALFGRVFTSAGAGMRKPDLAFYRFLLDETKLESRSTLYIDDKLENVISARSFGLTASIFRGADALLVKLQEVISRPVPEALAYLKESSSNTPSVTDTGCQVHENFAKLLIAEALGLRIHADDVGHQRLFNFFQDISAKNRGPFPCDLDTTSIAWTVLDDMENTTIQGVMDEMLLYINADGIVQVYFDSTRPRIDPVVCVNVLTLFYTHGRGDELAETFKWVYTVLEHRAYVDGTLYYHGADTFLYFASRLAAVSPVAHARLHPLLRNRIAERFGADSDALALAMRVVAAARSGLCDLVDHRRLLALQEEDGSWPVGWMYKYGGSGVLIGNKRLTTAIAVEALRAMDDLECVNNGC